jgi:hypothetical protein
MMYLWSRFSTLIDGRRLYMFIDEFWRALEDEFLEHELKKRYKTIRKQNWFLICATQSPADALKSSISHTVIEQTATFVYLPNPKAQEKDYTEGFNVTREVYSTIKNLPDKSRRFVVQQGHNAVVCELDLDGCRRRARGALRHHGQHIARGEHPPARRQRPNRVASDLPARKEGGMSPCTRIAALVLASACGAARAGIPVVGGGYELKPARQRAGGSTRLDRFAALSATGRSAATGRRRRIQPGKG